MARQGMEKYRKGIGETSFRQLECFVAVAEEGRFVTAAKRLRTSQPPVTRLIHRLERSLGARLFDRTPRGAELTTVGQALLDPARRTLAEVLRMTEAARRVAAGEMGSLNVGFSSSAALSVMPDLIGRYRTRYPDVHLTLRELPTAEQLQLLRQGLIDVAVARGPIESDAFTTVRLHRDQFVAALPKGHRLTEAAAVPLSKLTRERFIFIPRHVAPAFYDDVLRRCRRVGVTLVAAEEAAEWHTIAGLVGAGLGVSMMPASLQRLAWETVVFRPLSGCRLHADLLVACRTPVTSPLIKAFCDVVTSRQASR